VSAVLVTGGAGYHREPRRESPARGGREVVVYDNLSAGHREAVAALEARHPGRVRLVEATSARPRASNGCCGTTAPER